VISLGKTSRLQPASADWWGPGRAGGLRANGTADENGKSGAAAALPQGSSHRASALRPDATTSTRESLPLRRPGRPGQAGPAARHAGRPAARALGLGPVGERKHRPPGQSGRAKRSSDRDGTAQPEEDGQDHHTHATRKGHWTWRFKEVPWDRHSSGRKRRSGRRFSGGSPREDHVKVAGRGAPTWNSCWLAGRRGFGPCQDNVPTANVQPALRRSASPSLGGGTRTRTTTTEWHEQTLDWQSPWEHRAAARLKSRTDATDFTADQSPEVGQTGTTFRSGALACEERRARRKKRRATARGNRPW
jgi:hypothetical protein